VKSGLQWEKNRTMSIMPPTDELLRSCDYAVLFTVRAGGEALEREEMITSEHTK
jgi:hypothetical protein